MHAFRLSSVLPTIAVIAALSGAAFTACSGPPVAAQPTASTARTAGLEILSGPAEINDGDTIAIAGTRIRLHGIDAPEADQTCQRASGREWDCAGAATSRLRELTAERTVACDPVELDRYGRVVAVCKADGLDVQRVLAAEGLAWAYRQYSQAYVPAEDAARAEGAGVWQGPAQPPWEWRRSRGSSSTAAESAPDGCDIKGNISNNGRIYHTRQSPWYEKTRISEDRGERWFCSEAEAVAAGWRAARR